MQDSVKSMAIRTMNVKPRPPTAYTGASNPRAGSWHGDKNPVCDICSELRGL